MDAIERHSTISRGILAVREIIRTSQYPSDHPDAKHHLKICEKALRDALVNACPVAVERLFAVSENALKSADEAARRKKEEQQKMIEGAYRRPACGRGGVYI